MAKLKSLVLLVCTFKKAFLVMFMQMYQILSQQKLAKAIDQTKGLCSLLTCKTSSYRQRKHTV